MRFLLFLLLLYPITVLASGSIVMRTAMEENAQPKWISKSSGICPDILKALEKQDKSLNFSLLPELLPQKRLIDYVRQGQLDLACGLGGRPEDKAELFIPDIPLYSNKLMAVVASNDTLQISTLEGLKALPATDLILVNLGARLVGRLNAMGIHNVDSGGYGPARNLRKIAAGHGRIFLYHEPGLSLEVKNSGLAEKLRILPNALEESSHYLLLSNKLPPDVISAITQALRKIKENGTLTKIISKYSDEAQ